MFVLELIVVNFKSISHLESKSQCEWNESQNSMEAHEDRIKVWFAVSFLDFDVYINCWLSNENSIRNSIWESIEVKIEIVYGRIAWNWNLIQGVLEVNCSMVDGICVHNWKAKNESWTQGSDFESVCWRWGSDFESLVMVNGFTIYWKSISWINMTNLILMLSLAEWKAMNFFLQRRLYTSVKNRLSPGWLRWFSDEQISTGV